jgi:hypothetical protein
MSNYTLKRQIQISALRFEQAKISLEAANKEYEAAAKEWDDLYATLDAPSAIDNSAEVLPPQVDLPGVENIIEGK